VTIGRLIRRTGKVRDDALEKGHESHDAAIAVATGYR
jgi:hypothetical protein